MAKAVSSSKSVSSLFYTVASVRMTEAEARWALFVATDDLAFLSNNHASQLFKRMFKDSDIAKKFSCARTKCTAIIKEALASYFTGRIVKQLDPDIEDVWTRYLDMPIVILLPIYIGP